MARIVSLRLAAAGCLAILAASPALGSEATGTWQTEPGDSGSYIHVEIDACDADASRLCGTIVETFAGANPDLVGRQIIADMAPDGPGTWSGGTIWAPDENETYSSEMELSGDTLTVSGCVLAGLICRGQDWSRVD